MAGTIRKRRGFTALPNATVHDKALSYRALGLLLSLHSRPDGASFDLRRFVRDGHEQRTALLSARKELVTAGYIGHRRVKRKGGIFNTLTIIDTEPMSAETIEQELDAMVRDEVVPRSVHRSPGSGCPTPAHPTPDSPTVLPTGGHPSSSTPSGREEEEEVNARECPHGEPRGPRACPLCRQAGRRP